MWFRFAVTHAKALQCAQIFQGPVHGAGKHQRIVEERFSRFMHRSAGVLARPQPADEIAQTAPSLIWFSASIPKSVIS